MPGTGGKSKQSAFMQRCVADLIADGKDKAAAFAICKAGGNKAGYFKPGSTELTGKGKARSAALAKEPDMAAKGQAYQSILVRAHEALGEKIDLVVSAQKKPPREWNQKEFARIAEKIAEMGSFAEIRREQSQLYADQQRNYRQAEKAGAIKDPTHPLTLAAEDMMVLERLFAQAIGLQMGRRRMAESTSRRLARIEALPEAIDVLLLEGWNCAEAVSGVSVADAVEDLIADYGDAGQITLAEIGKELLDIGKNNPNSIRQAVEALKKAGIKVVRR